jgi:hypothetical protein
LLTGIAIAQYVYSSRIGCEIPSDLARTFGAKTQWKIAAGIGCLLLQICQDAAGFDGYCVIGKVEITHTIKPFKAQNELPGPRNRSSAQTSIATLWYQ